MNYAKSINKFLIGVIILCVAIFNIFNLKPSIKSVNKKYKVTESDNKNKRVKLRPEIEVNNKIYNMFI